MVKVCIVSPVHDSTDIRIFKKQVVSLHKLGYKISAICKTDSAGLSKTLGIEVIPLNYTTRLTRFFSLPRIIYLALKEKSDIYHIHNPDTLPVGLALKFFGKRVIYDTHENFRKKILLRDWIPKPIRSFTANSVFYGEKLLSIFFNATIVTQKEQCHDYAKSYLIGNSPIYSVRHNVERNKRSAATSIRLVYLGGISEDRGLSNMLNLCFRMNDIYPTELYLIGPTINALTKCELVKQISQYENVFYKGVLGQDAAFDFVCNCDFGLILLDDVADYKDTSPNKLFEYMMLGTPFIASNFPNWEDTLKCCTGGIFINPSKITSDFSKLIIDSRNDINHYNNLSKSGEDFIKNYYNWAATDEPKLVYLYKKILGAL